MKKKIIILVPILIIIAIIINYIMLNNLDLQLISNNEIFININDKWNDPGFTLKNEKYKKNVKITNNLDLNKEGLYEVTYTLKLGILSKKITRKIHVLNENEKTGFIFSLNGDNPYYLMKDNPYNEPSFTAYDEIDGDLKNKVQIENNINIYTPGEYEIIYKISNTQGITKEIKRKVIIYSFDFNSSIKNTNYSQDNEIIININDHNYDYTILPDNQISYERKINYYISENGLYNFTFYDKNHVSQKYQVKIDNIDKEKPTGACTLHLFDNYGEINVTAIDNTEINGYVYNYGKNKTELNKNNKYRINTMDEEANVTIYDTANNYTDIKCNIIDNSTKYERTYTLKTYYYNNYNNKYWFYTPKNNTARKKMPLLVYFHGDGGRPNVERVNRYAFPKFINDGMDFPFYMIAPYCNNETDFSSLKMQDYIIHLIKEITTNYNIDIDRIIISGGSSGARGAYKIAATYKDIFSCLVIGSGIIYQLSTFEKDLTYLPIWIFHGTKDKSISISDVEHSVKNIQKYGGNIKFSEIDGGHDITEEVFKSPELIEWMISQKRISQ